MNWREPTLSACTRKALSCESRSLQNLSLYCCFDLREAAAGILLVKDGVSENFRTAVPSGSESNKGRLQVSVFLNRVPLREPVLKGSAEAIDARRNARKEGDAGRGSRYKTKPGNGETVFHSRLAM